MIRKKWIRFFRKKKKKIHAQTKGTKAGKTISKRKKKSSPLLLEVFSERSMSSGHDPGVDSVYAVKERKKTASNPKGTRARFIRNRSGLQGVNTLLFFGPATKMRAPVDRCGGRGFLLRHGQALGMDHCPLFAWLGRRGGGPEGPMLSRAVSRYVAKFGRHRAGGNPLGRRVSLLA